MSLPTMPGVHYTLPGQTADGTQLHWGSVGPAANQNTAPEQKSGFSWGKLAVRLAVGVGVVMAGVAGFEYFTGVDDGLFSSLFAIGTSAIASVTELTDSLAGVVSHVTGIGADASETTVTALKEASGELVAKLAEGKEFIIPEEVMTTLASTGQDVAVKDLLTGISTDLQALTPGMDKEAVEALMEGLKAKAEGVSNILTGKSGGIPRIIFMMDGTIDHSAVPEMFNTTPFVEANNNFINTLKEGLDEIGAGPGLFANVDGTHVAAGLGGAGIALTANKMLSKTPATERMAPSSAPKFTQAPAAPHPDHIRPDHGAFTQKFYRQDMARHLAEQGIAVEGPLGQSQAARFV